MKKFILFAVVTMLLVGCNQQPKVMENQAIQNILTRVSVREFTGEKISEAQLDTLLRAAMSAPSAINKQPWAFIVVTDEAKIAALGEALPYSRCSNHPAVCGNITITKGVTSVTATKGEGAVISIGVGDEGTCGKVTIGGTVYYENNAYVGTGSTYLTQSPLVYEP